MLDANNLIKASLDAGRDLLRPSTARRNAEPGKRGGALLVPIRSLGANHRERIAHHLLALEPNDRYLRFGYAAQDEQIQRYVAGLNFERDEIFGIYNRKLELIAMAHLAHSESSSTHASCAEFGVSVLPRARGRGYGARLFERAAMHATNSGISLLFIHALSENAAMLKIARNAGATIARDGTESEAFLQLPQSTLDSHVTELLAEQMAITDYHIKVQAKQFWNFLGDLQDVRKDAIDAQSRSSP